MGGGGGQPDNNEEDVVPATASMGGGGGQPDNNEEDVVPATASMGGGGGQPDNNEELPREDTKCPLEKLSCLDKNGLPRDFEKLLDKLRKVKDLRNKIMHGFEVTLNHHKFSDLETALSELIEEAERVYSLSQSEVEDQKKNLHDDFERLQTLDKKSIYYWCTRLTMSGKLVVKNLWRIKLTEETLPLDNSIVQRKEVFHSLDVMVRRARSDGPKGQVLPYPEIFKAPEKAIIISGVAGAGKTSLLKNIVLQFFELQEGNADYLRQFDQLILFECRDRTTETLADVIEQHFEDLCRELEGKRIVLDALLRLDALIVIDGYDEVNKVSTNVVREIIKKTSSSNCRVLITTRPHSAENLEKLLATNDVISTEFEIKPLTELVEQLEFLTRYEKGLGITEGEMTESFKTLNIDVRILFTEPINLILFCDMHKHMPETISSWEQPGDVANDILRLYKKLVTIKLADVTHLECDVMLDDLFVVIGKAALDFIRENAVTFSEKELLQVKRKCIPILNNTVECSSEIILSVVLKVNRPLSGAGETTYTFHHKSIQEMFAAEFIVQRILASNDSLKSILDAKPEEMRSLREVLQYAVQGLSRCKPRLLERRWPELEQALRDAGVVSAADWEECLRICPDVEQVAKPAALSKLKRSKTWHVETGRDVALVAAMLPYAQPDLLEVNIKPDAPSKRRWAELVQRRVGPVLLELQNPAGDEYKSNDDLLLPMLGTRVRLVHFEGCVGTCAGTAALASVARGAVLRIRMAAPLDLSALKTTCWRKYVHKKRYKLLTVYTRPLPPPCHSSPTWPLPPSPPPELYVEGADEGSWGAVAHTVTSLAPPGKRFLQLWLRGSRLKSVEFPPLLRALHDAGARTGDGGDGGNTRAEVWRGYVRLHIEDRAPPREPAVPSDAKLLAAYQEYLRLRRQ
ncbi:uncharacterized protein LOC125178231 [Hyalella azteca]|uniref:Uncharacterized protein LOC125178231 n=1 Tax=Hyalella azteca TaxID=294128 RepID=A0A979FL49_HYAAZ|nr:uncharacterized protein LOC125178231 [Hyalella azteca]